MPKDESLRETLHQSRPDTEISIDAPASRTMTFLVTLIAVALTIEVGGVILWGWFHDALRTSEQERFDWVFDQIVRNATGELPGRDRPSTVSLLSD